MRWPGRSARARACLAVDVAGRGHSDWLADPMQYQVPQYAADLAALVLQVQRESPDAVIDWVGTSMGGLIGMAMAAQPEPGHPSTGAQRCGARRFSGRPCCASRTYLGLNPSFDSEAGGQLITWRPFRPDLAPHTPEQWLALSRPMLREREGRWWLHYDPALAVPFKALTEAKDGEAAAKAGEAALWGLYDAIKAPTLLLARRVSRIC